MTDSPWLTIDEAAQYAKWSEEKMRVLVEKRKIPHSKAGRHVRIHVADLDHYLRSRIIAVTDKAEVGLAVQTTQNGGTENVPLSGSKA